MSRGWGPASGVKYPAMHTLVMEMTCAIEWAEAHLGTLRDSRSGLDRVGAVSGLNLGSPAAGASGSVQADVAGLGGLGGEVLRQEVIAERLQ